MTVANTPRTAGPYLGVGTVTVYAFGFKVFLTSDVLVQITTAAGVLSMGVLGTDYSVSLNADQNNAPGGNVILTLPLASGATLAIGSQVPLTQGVVLTNPGNWYPQVVSDALDRVTILIQQALSSIVGALRIPELTATSVLPAAAQRANKLLSFDATGNPITVAPSAGTATALSTALADSSTGSNGAALVGLGSNQTYNLGTIGDHEQRLGRLATDYPWLADATGVADAKAAGQAHIDYMNGLGNATNKVLASRFPAGTYKLSAGLTSHTSGSGQSGIAGDGPLATVFSPSADFTVLTLATSVHDSGNLYIAWPSSTAATTRVGVHLADATNQVDQCELGNMRVDYAYRAFVADPSSASIYLFKQRNLYAFRPLDWGFYYDMPNGSTTFTSELLYVRGDTTGGLPTAKGIFVNNATDVYMETTAVDQCKDTWITIQNANTCNLQNTAIESNRIATPGAVGINLIVDRAVMTGLKDVTNTYDVTSGTANVIGLGATTKSLVIGGYSEQFSTVVAGTIKYKVTLNAPTSHLFVTDNSIAPADVNFNGYGANGTFGGQRLAMGNVVPTYAGGWFNGQRLQYAAPVAGGSEGLVCLDATAGAGVGTWAQVGNVKLQTQVIYDPPNIGSGAQAATPVTVTGAAPGDLALAAFTNGLQGMIMWAHVEGANTVQVRLRNDTGAAIDLASGTLTVRVWKQ